MHDIRATKTGNVLLVVRINISYNLKIEIQNYSLVLFASSLQCAFLFGLRKSKKDRLVRLVFLSGENRREELSFTRLTFLCFNKLDWPLRNDGHSAGTGAYLDREFEHVFICGLWTLFYTWWLQVGAKKTSLMRQTTARPIHITGTNKKILSLRNL